MQDQDARQDERWMERKNSKGMVRKGEGRGRIVSSQQQMRRESLKRTSW